MNNPQKANFQQPPEKNKGLFGFFQADKSQISSIRIGIWGTVSSGKTIYLVRLCELLTRSGKFRVQPGSEKAKNFFEQLLRNMNNENKDGILPPPTLYKQGNNNVEILTYKLEPLSSEFGTATIILEFIDAPGEFFEKPSTTLTINNVDKSSRYTNIIDYLISCHGIIFLLDPLRKDDANDDYFGLLLNLFTTFQIRSYPDLPKVPILEQYMAFCVTKVDDNDEFLKKGSTDLVQDVMGKTMWDCLQKNFSSVELDFNKRQKPNRNNRCNFYSTSAFGRFKNEQGQSEKFLQYPSIPEDDIPQDLNGIPNNEIWNWEEEYINNNQPPINNPAPAPRLTLDDIGQDVAIEVDNQAKLIIKQRKDGCNPSNIIEPLEWLIKSIIKHPPTLPNIFPNHN